MWVELGLQTIHEDTARYIRRGYPLSCFEDAFERLQGEGLETIVHTILGLPGESREDILKGVETLALLHKSMKMPFQKFYAARSLEEEYIRHNQELRKIRKYIRKKGASEEFEKDYLAGVYGGIPFLKEFSLKEGE